MREPQPDARGVPRVRLASSRSTMWMWYARAPAPDAAYWPGRRLLAVVDALAWPTLLATVVVAVPVDTGIVGAIVVAGCVLAGVRRCARAVWRNERYRFTTWRWGVPLATLIVLGGALKLAL